MSCNNCFNGCAETISDQCVKYTGIDIPALGISTGDNLLAVENAITTFLVPAINGTGIKPIIDPNIICDIVKGYLPACTTCTGFTLNEVLTAIVKTVCDLQEQIDVIDVTLATLNADYTIGCLTGVTASSDTHAIVQAVITNLCSLNSAFSLLVTQLNATNVTIFNVNSYIAAYLDSINFLESAKDKMIPYAPIPYFGLLSNYPNTGDNLVGGVGIGYWDKVYLCNGDNGTPDLRGWTLVGVTTGMGGSTIMPTTVNPSTIGNFNYSVGLTNGTNTVQLTTGELPNHGHPGSTVAITDPGHTHTVTGSFGNGGSPAGTFFLVNNADNDGDKTVGTIIPDITGITAVPTINPYGGGTAHANVQPSRGCYYIMYKP
jgi:microcystin-dependent protein